MSILTFIPAYFDDAHFGTLLTIHDDVLIEGLQVYEECFNELF